MQTDTYVYSQINELQEKVRTQAEKLSHYESNQKIMEDKILDCSTYLIKTLQILERVVPLIVPVPDDSEQSETIGEFSLSDAIIALEHLKTR